MAKNDDRGIAAEVLAIAQKAVMVERADQHGDAENSFLMIAELWNVYIAHARARRDINNVELTGADVAQMMTLLKIARATYGNPNNPDHYADAAGYQSLAAMINGADPRN